MQEFAERFPTETACRDYLAEVRWKMSFVCSRCGNTEKWSTRRKTLKCTRCRLKISVTAGTAFQDSHVPLHSGFKRFGAWCRKNMGGGHFVFPAHFLLHHTKPP